MTKSFLASLALAIMALGIMPAPEALSAEPIGSSVPITASYYRIIPISQGGTVSEMCAAIPREVRGDSIYGCWTRALRLSGIEDDRRIFVGTPITIPVAAPALPEYPDSSPNAEVGSPRSIHAPESTSPTEPQTNWLWILAAGVVLVGIVLAGIRAVATRARRYPEKETIVNAPSERDRHPATSPQQPRSRPQNEDTDMTFEEAQDNLLEAMKAVMAGCRHMEREVAEVRAEAREHKSNLELETSKRERAEQALALANRDKERLTRENEALQTQLNAANAAIGRYRQHFNAASDEAERELRGAEHSSRRDRDNGADRRV